MQKLTQTRHAVGTEVMLRRVPEPVQSSIGGSIEFVISAGINKGVLVGMGSRI